MRLANFAEALLRLAKDGLETTCLYCEHFSYHVPGKTSMPQHTTPRQPLSCENCRKRRIKCESKDQVKVPCSTCVRRGYAQSCYYKKVADAAQFASVSTENELLHRIRNLEDLLKKQIAQSSQSPSDFTQGRESSRSNGTSPFVPTVPKPRYVGSIITSPSGYQYFSPRASTLNTNLVPELVSAVPAPTCATDFPFTPDSISSRSALLEMLPPLRQCDELKSVFFEVFSPLFHVLHDPTFDAIYNRVRLDPSTVSLSWLALLFVVLSVAVTSLDGEHPLLRDLGRESSAIANIRKLSAKYRSAAMQCLAADQFLYQHNLQTVQALVLMIYAMNHANIASWALLGMTWNIAVRIGCHIDPSKLGLDIVVGEERRRCFAALMMLYTVQNTCLGNLAPQAITTDVDLPADVDDEDLGVDGTIENAHWPTKMSYILYKFRLYNIAAEICQCAAEEEYLDQQTILALDQKLAVEEHEHTTRFSHQNLPLYHMAHHYILQSYTHHLYLILHRASLNSRSLGDDVLRSRRRCKTSAMTILEVHAHLCDTAEFRPYQWYVYGLGSFHAFLALSVLIVLSQRVGMDDGDRVRLLGLIDQSMNRFDVMADRSDICARAVAILRRAIQNSNSVAAGRIFAGTLSSLPQNDAPRQYPLSPTSEPERFLMDGCNWTSNPELEALLFDAGPEQWMAPTSFTWDHWNNAVFV